VLLDLGGQGIEMLWSEGPSTLDTIKGISEDDKMLLNCPEHVSYARVCYLICHARLTFSL
jgi:hypothetical protein